MAEDFNSLDISALAAKLKDKTLTAEDKKQLDSAIWSKVSNIGKRIEQLNPQDKDQLKSFRSLLKSLPSAYRQELGEKLDIIKSAETRLFRAERGIDDRSVGDKLKDGLEQGVDNVKQGAAKLQRNFNVGKRFARMAINKKQNQVKTWVKAKKQGYDNWVDSVDAKIDAWVNKAGTALENLEKMPSRAWHNVKHNVKQDVAKLQRNFNVGKRFARMAINKKQNQVKTWVKAKKQGYDNWVDSVDAKIDAWVNKAGTALENIEKGIREIPANIKSAGAKVFNQMRSSIQAGKARAKARQEALKRRRQQQWQRIKTGLKMTAKGTMMVAGGMAAVIGKGAVWSAKQLRRGWQLGKRIINGIKLPEVKGYANENNSILDMANGNLAALKPEQIKNLYNELKQYRDTARGNKYGDAYYRVSAYSTELLNEIKSKGKDGVTDENADKVAAWLEVNKNIQEEVNKNRAIENEQRNAEVEKILNDRRTEAKPRKKGMTMSEDEYAPYKAFAEQLGLKDDMTFVRECQDGKYKDAFAAFQSNYQKRQQTKEDQTAERQAEARDNDQPTAEADKKKTAQQEAKVIEEQAAQEQRQEPQENISPTSKEEVKEEAELKQPASQTNEAETRQPEPQAKQEENTAADDTKFQRPRAATPEYEAEAAAAASAQPESNKRRVKKSNLRKIQELRGVEKPRKTAKQVTMDNRGKFQAKENQGEEAKQIDMTAYIKEAKERA